MKNKIFGYVRVSTQEQDVETQKNKIREYCEKHRIMIDEWIEIEISSRKSTEARKIDELLGKLNQGDTVIVYELSRLCRSMHEMLNIVNEIVDMKKVRLISITQDIDINPNDKKDIKNTILVWIFSLLADLERTFISQRTKDALRARVAKGVKLGKPVGTIQESIYDKDDEIIFELLKHEVPVKRISRKLKYGTYQSLRYFIERRRKIHIRYRSKP